MSVLKNYFNKIANTAKSVIVGMGITARYFGDKSEIVTIQYGSKKYAPQERYIPDRHRGVHYLETEKCIMCEICAKACPVDCIDMEGTRDGVLEGGWQADKVILSRFVLDLNKCIFCNLCCEPCPKECIHMGQEFDVAAYTRSNGVKNMLTDGAYTPADADSESQRRDQIAELAAEKKRARDEAKKKKAAAKKAAAEKKDKEG